MEYKVEIGGVTYGMEKIQSASIEHPLFDKLSVGNACSAELEISFWPTETVPRMAMIIPYCRESSADEWYQLGVFYTDTRSLRNGIMTLVAYDAMLKSDTVWEPDQDLVFPMTMTEAVTEIISLMGVELDSRTVLKTGDDYVIDYPANDYTLRDVLRFIAAANAGNWIITDAGKLLLVPLFSSMPAETNYLVTEDGDAITFGGVRILV